MMDRAPPISALKRTQKLEFSQMNVSSYHLQSAEGEHGTGEWLCGKCYYQAGGSFMFAEEGDVWLVRGPQPVGGREENIRISAQIPQRRGWQGE